MNPRIPVRYLGWMARDAAVRPGVVCLVFAGLFAFMSTRMPGTLNAASARDFLVRTVGQSDWLIILVATAGLVSADRASGYYRSLFSQPVNPGLYYLQRWLVGGVPVALYVPLVGLGLFAVSGSFPYSGALLERLMLKYLLLGGLTFALSTVVKTDWLIAFMVSLLQGVLYGLEKAGAPISAFTKALAHALPPFQVGSVGFLGSTGYTTGAELTHTFLYGAALLVVALSVLALRPLGSGGRA